LIQGPRYLGDRLPCRFVEIRAYITRMNLQLSDKQSELLARELRALIDNDKYFLSSWVQTLQEIVDMIRPEPPRPAPPRIKHYEPPRVGRNRRRG
jgi:hypothetical protein